MYDTITKYFFLAKNYPDHSNALLVKYPANEIHKAYHRLTGGITDILAAKDFKKLRRACYHEISAPTSTLPVSLAQDLKPTKSLDDMLDVLALSPYWNWFDTRLLQALVSASGSPEAEAMLEQFKQIYYACKVSEVLPCVIVKPIKDSIVFIEKFDKDPEELTLLDLLQHKQVLEYDVMDVGENRIVLSCIKTGCVELMWQVPLDLLYQVYTSIKKHNLSSLAIKSMVCMQADEHAGLPILWHGQKVEEVGLVEPLPENIRQQPYSLPQGFYWVNLSCNDVEEIAKFSNKHYGFNSKNDFYNFIIMHPTTKDEWHFGIRTTNGKLVGVVLAYPLCISIGGVSITCMDQLLRCHPKYYGRRLNYMFIRELMRRGNICDINHLILTTNHSSILKPIIKRHMWIYTFDHPTNSQLPSSPRTPGWRRMTSKDIPSALALINKWSSQFEIRRIFNSQEEFFHHFICPAISNLVHTYVVENETNDITDLISICLSETTSGTINPVVSIQSPVNVLITDALVCAKEFGVKMLTIFQHTVKPDVLLSLSFQYKGESLYSSIYNYKYHEVPTTEFWCM